MIVALRKKKKKEVVFMRIDGANNILSNIIHRPIQVMEKDQIGPYAIKKEVGILDISESGRRLHFRSDSTKLNEVQATTGGDPILKQL
jgi:hypothetical protein